MHAPSIMASAPHYTSSLLRHALPLIPRHGFSLHTLQLASQAVPSTSSTSSSTSSSSSSSSSPLSLSTLNALFPSPSSRSHPNGTVSRRKTLTREQLIREARAQAPSGTASTFRSPLLGPLKALVQAWLEQGRMEMVQHVAVSRGKANQDQLVKLGLRHRIKYNEPVVDQLVEALALLGAPTSTPLSSPSALLPFPSPLPHFEHVARIAHDLAAASDDESQGLEWYSVRASLGTLYGLSELHQLSPQLQGLEPSQRRLETYEFLDRIWDKSDGLAGLGAFRHVGAQELDGDGNKFGLVGSVLQLKM
ncbi:BQ5605_C007g04426 [Microbotryum silenes-dioicae]|uniref:BQ5605_C007g04426 protein n=1 Tax=Microbotryum silenes-dioicae TaxID=796604 RepID=A0A2X0M9Y1_9BASI|nr:BQ5605_C007g04426 [Microbotryum silenes-dioicae]